MCKNRYKVDADVEDIGMLSVTEIGWYGSIYDMSINIRTRTGSACQFSIKGDFCSKKCMFGKIREEIKIRQNG